MMNFILDVDGCLNDGKIYWGVDGKPFKAFGNYDHDGLKFLKKHLNIMFITADKSGWDITQSRIVDHMDFSLALVPENKRFEYVEAHNFDQTIYMGDGYFDAPIIKAAKIGIAPAQGRIEARESADYVTPSRGGEGAVMDACMYIIKQMGIKL
jgi:3-deoxy-D-manno-octulosonate 8-phosphate phosphatase (KDO 8-P phosphatase)